jgi:hypothetical protein
MDMLVVSGIELPVVPRSMLEESWLHHACEWGSVGQTQEARPGVNLPDGIVDIESPRILREAVYEVMLVFRAQTGLPACYDVEPKRLERFGGPQGMGRERPDDRAFLWAKEGDGDVPIVGALVAQYHPYSVPESPMPGPCTKFVGCMHVWVWCHPDETERMGRTLWPYLDRRFGSFLTAGMLQDY